MKIEIFVFFHFLQLLLLHETIGQDSEPSLPSNLPSPPKPPAPPGRRPGGGAGGRGVANAALPGSLLPNPPPQNAPVGPPTPEQPPPPPPPVPFGLDHIILILVPQFKTTVPHLPKWMGANSKLSIPITIFFDKLKVSPPPPVGTYPANPINGPRFPGGHFVQKRSAEKLLLEHNKRVSPEEASNDHYRNDGRRKQSSLLKDATFRAERVTLIPSLATTLESFGLGGKSCLLRTICEAHEFPLQHHGYGLLGEVLTLFFSISRSSFADSHHLSEYLEAEDVGKAGNCTRYFKQCGSSLFFWERIHGNEPDFGEDELDLLNELF